MEAVYTQTNTGSAGQNTTYSLPTAATFEMEYIRGPA